MEAALVQHMDDEAIQAVATVWMQKADRWSTLLMPPGANDQRTVARVSVPKIINTENAVPKRDNEMDLTTEEPVVKRKKVSRKSDAPEEGSDNSDEDDELLVPLTFRSESDKREGMSWGKDKRKKERINMKVYYHKVDKFTTKIGIRVNMPRGVSRAAGYAILMGAGWELHWYQTQTNMQLDSMPKILKEMRKEAKQLWTYDDFNEALRAFSTVIVEFLPYEAERMRLFSDQARTKYDEICRANNDDREVGVRKFLIFFHEVKLVIENETYEFGDPEAWTYVTTQVFPNSREIDTNDPFKPEQNWVRKLGPIGINTPQGRAITARNPNWERISQTSIMHGGHGSASRGGSFGRGGGYGQNRNLGQQYNRPNDGGYYQNRQNSYGSGKKGDCSFWIRFGNCKYGDQCDSNHPPGYAIQNNGDGSNSRGNGGFGQQGGPPGLRGSKGDDRQKDKEPTPNQKVNQENKN